MEWGEGADRMPSGYHAGVARATPLIAGGQWPLTGVERPIMTRRGDGMMFELSDGKPAVQNVTRHIWVPAQWKSDRSR